MIIILTGDYSPEICSQIRRDFPEEWNLRIVPAGELRRELRDADVLIPEHTPVDAALLAEAPSLRMIQTGAGYDNVDLAACRAKGVQVFCAAGINADAVAEHVMAFLLCWYKNLLPLDRCMKTGKGENSLSYRGSELAGKTIGILGLGAVGSRVAALCVAFQMRVLGCSLSKKELPGVEQTNLERLLRESDVITLHVPLNDSTRHLIRAEQISLMKQDALLINTSRGAVLCEEDLIRALEQGRIAGACLDVFEREPLPADSPLRSLPNVILTPHTAGLPDGYHYHQRRFLYYAENIGRFFRGDLPGGAVDPR